MNINAISILNKAVDLEHILIKHGPSIVAITQPWLKPGMLDDEIVPPAYRLIQKDRLARGGGVALVVKKPLKCTEIAGAPDIQNVSCKVKTTNLEFIFGAVYHPPSSEVDVIIKLNAFLVGIGALTKRL